MTDFAFLLYSVGGVVAQMSLRNIITATIAEELAGAHTMRLELNPVDTDGSRYIGVYPDDSADWDAAKMLQIGKWIKVIGPTGINNSFIQSFIIRKIEQRHTTDGIVYALDCESTKYKLLDRVANINREYAQLTAQQYLTLVFNAAAGSGFTLGTNDIPTTETRNVVMKYPTLLEALNYVCDNWTVTTSGTQYRFYYFVSDANVITIRNENNVGHSIPAMFSMNAPIKDFTGGSDGNGLVNRVYVQGMGNDLIYSQRLPVYDSTVGGVLTTLSGNETYNFNANGAYAGYGVAIESYICIQFNTNASGTTWPSAAGSYVAHLPYRLYIGATPYPDGSSFGNLQFPAVSYGSRQIGTYAWIFINVGRVSTGFNSLVVYPGAMTIVRSTSPVCDVVSPSVQRRAAMYELSSNLPYVQDTTSQTNYGLVEATIENTKHPLVINAVRDYYNVSTAAVVPIDSTFSGTYTAGLADMLIKQETTIDGVIGVVTCAENSVALLGAVADTFILNGTKSQKVICSIGGIGVNTSLYLKAEPMISGSSYNLIVNLYVVSGKVSVLVETDSGYPFSATTAGIGWVQLVSDTPFGDPFSSNSISNIYVYFLSAETKATFYLDSFCLARTAEPIDFYKVNSADDLRTEALALLNANKVPKTQYDVNYRDLLFAEQRPDYFFSVGDKLQLAHCDWSMRDMRVVRRELDLLNPDNSKMMLADKSVSLATLINRIGKTNNLGGI
jgi:hypothetical protein